MILLDIPPRCNACPNMQVLRDEYLLAQLNLGVAEKVADVHDDDLSRMDIETAEQELEAADLALSGLIANCKRGVQYVDLSKPLLGIILRTYTGISEPPAPETADFVAMCRSKEVRREMLRKLFSNKEDSSSSADYP